MKEEIRKQCAIILCLADKPYDCCKNFPHSTDFTGDEMAKLKKLFTAGNKDNKHIVTLVPVGHPNNGEVEDITGGKMTDNLIQRFGNNHCGRGNPWLFANIAY